jgi:hypothetical protein
MENKEEIDMDYDYQSDNEYNASKLIEEQDLEYEKCMQKDIQNQIEKQEIEELKQIQEDSWYYERDRKRERVPLEPGLTESYTNMAFRFSIEGITRRITRKFYKSNTLKNIFDFIESQDFLPVLSQCEIYMVSPMSMLKPTEEKIGEKFGNSCLLHINILS